MNPSTTAPLIAGPLTKSDVKAIRQHIASTPFLHWGRLASEWGLPASLLKHLTGFPTTTSSTK
jgi:hypothetical protein